MPARSTHVEFDLKTQTIKHQAYAAEADDAYAEVVPGPATVLAVDTTSIKGMVNLASADASGFLGAVDPSALRRPAYALRTAAAQDGLGSIDVTFVDDTRGGEAVRGTDTTMRDVRTVEQFLSEARDMVLRAQPRPQATHFAGVRVPSAMKPHKWVVHLCRDAGSAGL
ncbi:hypothetical protein HMN09_00379200 [Mycena chlorophos]|uniref:Uncharacterized protein n=1 Tax=Mycena chlorophos TaxID=658473 RepID=A0A8H6TJH2_MYCCL|nr:hypothetical protein HMN09_00379200 [Mycena chlorophos]